MSSPNRKRFKLQTIRNRQANEKGDAFEIEADNGEVFTVPAPGFWPDEVKDLFAEGKEVAAVKALMGAREYLRFRAAGGRADDVALAMKAFAKDEQGVEVGESSASSSS